MPTGIRRPVVLLAHRGPALFQRTEAGRTVRRAAGGLVTALTGLAEHLNDAVWVCAAATREDAAVAAEHEGHALDIAFEPHPRLLRRAEESSAPTFGVRYVEVEEAAHEAFYTVIANPLLWFIQHGLYGLATAPEITRETHRAFQDGYVRVNRLFADAVAAEVERSGGRALVMLHDYHFYLVGAQVRQRCPDAVISHFVHIPWPGPDDWRILPPDMRNPLLAGLLGCDVVAFHTQRFARNFLLTAQELLGLPIDLHSMSVQVDGRRVLARAYPISVDVSALESLAASTEVAANRRMLHDWLLRDGRQLVLRVDRTDPSKNVVRGFHAFDVMLCEHPELAGRVSFLALLMPSRQDVAEYTDYLAEIGASAATVNARHQQVGWQPIELRLQQDLPFAVAAYSLCDVLVVNAVNDGMNLVAKEAVLVNERDMVLALSETTGAHEELGEHALTLHPFDVEQQANAFYRALVMPRRERQARLGRAADVVRRNDVDQWLAAQLRDLAELVAD